MVMEMTADGKGKISARVFKHLAPVTLTRIQQSLPIGGRVNFFEKNFLYILTDIVAGEEKARFEFKRGSVAFMPAGSTICIFLKDTRSYKPMNLFGEMGKGIEILDSLKRGDSLRIERISALGSS
jgi:hypothetical protein